MLGMMEDVPFVNGRLELKRGDMLFLYTDGITEAMNGQRDLFGEAHLRDVLNDVPKGTAAEDVLAAVAAAVRTHADGAEQSDDITMLGLRYLEG